MKITKFVHSCLLVETPDRVALFDPGVYSKDAFVMPDQLDDILITHVHPDHCDPSFITELVAKFPAVRITGTQEIVDMLSQEGIKASTELPSGIQLFDSPHEGVAPLFNPPQENGYHYLDRLSHPGDSHSFSESKAILALPIQAPWGNTVNGVNLALKLKPSHILPIHDWHWRDEARQQMYDRVDQVFAGAGITFHKLETGQPVNIEVAM